MGKANTWLAGGNAIPQYLHKCLLQVEKAVYSCYHDEANRDSTATCQQPAVGAAVLLSIKKRCICAPSPPQVSSAYLSHSQPHKRPMIISLQATLRSCSVEAKPEPASDGSK